MFNFTVIRLSQSPLYVLRSPSFLLSTGLHCHPTDPPVLWASHSLCNKLTIENKIMFAIEELSDAVIYIPVLISFPISSHYVNSIYNIVNICRFKVLYHWLCLPSLALFLYCFLSLTTFRCLFSFLSSYWTVYCFDVTERFAICLHPRPFSPTLRTFYFLLEV